MRLLHDAVDPVVTDQSALFATRPRGAIIDVNVDFIAGLVFALDPADHGITPGGKSSVCGAASGVW